MSQEWDGKPLEDLISQDATVQDDDMSVWTFLEHMAAGRLLRITSAEAFSLALNEVFLEMYHNVLKRVCIFCIFLFLFVVFSLVVFVLSNICPMFPGLYVEKGACTQELD